MMQQISNLDNLPPEVREQFIGHVPPKDLCNLSLTSRSMRTLASNPKLWSGMTVKKSKIQQEGLAKLFNIDRFRKITKIDLSIMQFSIPYIYGQLPYIYAELQGNFNAILSSSVEDLNLENLEIPHIPAQLLGQVADHLHKINLGRTSLTNEQCLAVMESCISSSSLVNVSLEGIRNLRNVPAEIMRGAAGNLHTINLDKTFLTNEQCLAVLESCISSSSLVNVSLAGITSLRRHGPTGLLGQAVGHLQTINLDQTRLTNEQCIAVLGACISSSSLINVSLRYNDLLSVPAELLGRAASHLQTINLYRTSLSNDQHIALLESCISSSSLSKMTLSAIRLENADILLPRARNTGRLLRIVH